MKYELIAPRQYTSAIEQVLRNRGIEDVEHYLNTSDSDILDPLLLDNMERGAKMLVSHIKNEDKMYVQIDCDADGLTSAALMLNYLHKLFPQYVETKISYGQHEGKQHGIELDLIPEDVRLVLVPDAGTNDLEQHKALADRDIEVLIFDHHVRNDDIPSVACIINNQTCDYPNKTLSGVGIVYKFCCYLDSLFNVDYANDFLDLVAVGCIADMMSLQHYETRRLIDKGLSQIRNPFLSSMVEKNAYQLGERVTPFGVSFYIAPYINAVIRVGTAEEKDLLFESLLDFKAFDQIPSTKRGCKGQFETRVEQACRQCVNIKNRQTKTRDASLNDIEEIIENQNLLENKVLVIQLAEAQRTNLTGLLANQEMAKYQRPVLIVSPTEDEGGKLSWSGSMRGPSNTVESWKAFFENSKLVNYVQGHSHAAGISVPDENIKPFTDYCNTALKDFDFSPRYKVDFIYKSPKEIKPIDFYTLMEYSSIYGQAVEEPLIVIENVVITKDNLKVMKANTIKLTLTENIEAIKFKVLDQEIENLTSSSGCVIINVLGVVEKNTWNNQPQLIVREYEIIDKQDYYF